MRLVRVLLVLAVLFILVCAGFIALTWKSEIPRVARPDPAGFDPGTYGAMFATDLTGEIVPLSPVPEPSTWFAAALALGAVIWSLRRRCNVLKLNIDPKV